MFIFNVLNEGRKKIRLMSVKILLKFREIVVETLGNLGEI